jgi:sialidase-1
MDTATIAFLLSAPVTVFSSPSFGYNTYRIPALLNTKSNTLLAFVEGRKSQSDAADNRILLSRSIDKGRTWFITQVIAKPESGSYNNPTVVQCANKTIIVHFQHYPAGTHEYDVEPGITGPKTVQTYQITSTNEGKTWSKPTNFTAEIKNPLAHTLASGPGIGIQLTTGRKKGRIIIPYNQRIGKKWFVNMAISDDNGKSWHQGKQVPASPEYQLNEVQVAELANGAVLLNARNQADAKYRLTAISRDSGETFSRAELDKTLPDPTCQGSLLRFSLPKFKTPGILAFSNPANQESRTQGTLRISLDEGKTWPISQLIEADSFAYSSLTKLNNDTLGILYEHVENNRYKILFRTIKLQ